MPDIGQSIERSRDAVNEFVAAAEKAAGTWKQPRSPGKWSPSQLSEHVARSIEEAAKDLEGQPSKFPNIPWLLRPVARTLLFNRVLKNSAFPKARTSKPFDPPDGPDTPAAARARLEGAFAQFERACRARSASGQPVTSRIFGEVALEDYVRFNEVHTRHHRKQLPDSTRV